MVAAASSRARPYPKNRLVSVFVIGGIIMPVAYYLAAVDTILACLVTMAMGGWSGYLRGKYKIQAPAVTGHPAFERAHRAHINTVENLVVFVPVLWIASVFYGGQIPFW